MVFRVHPPRIMLMPWWELEAYWVQGERICSVVRYYDYTSNFENTRCGATIYLEICSTFTAGCKHYNLRRFKYLYLHHVPWQFEVIFLIHPESLRKIFHDWVYITFLRGSDVWPSIYILLGIWLIYASKYRVIIASSIRLSPIGHH